MKKIFLTILAFLFSLFLITAKAESQVTSNVSKSNSQHPSIFSIFDQSQFLSVIAELEISSDSSNSVNTNSQLQLLLANAYFSAGFYQKAIDCILANQTIIADQVLHDEAQLILGKAYAKQERFQDTIKVLNEIVKPMKDTLEDERWYYLTLSFIESGQFKQAEESLQKLSFKSLSRFYLQYNLATALINKNKADESIGMLEEISNATLNNSEAILIRDRARTQVGLYRLKQKKFTDAQAAFNKISLTQVGLNQLYLQIGLGWQQQSQYDKALQSWSAILSHNPKEPSVQQVMLLYPVALMQVGKYNNAFNRFRNTINQYNTQLGELDKIIAVVKAGEFKRALHATVVQDEASLFVETYFIPTSIAKPYLTEYFQSNKFQDAMKQYQVLKFIKRSKDKKLLRLVSLANTKKNNMSKLKPLDVMLSELEKSMSDNALAELLKQRKFLLENASQARFYQAQLYDIVRNRQIQNL